MGECGCNLDVHRCRDHADDVIVVLTRREAQAALVALELRRLADGWNSREMRDAAPVAERAIARALDQAKARCAPRGG